MNKSTSFHPRSVSARCAWCWSHRAEYPSLWAAIESIAPKIGCGRDAAALGAPGTSLTPGQREGVTTAERERVKELEREVKSCAGPTRS